jgi:hypothetical protein
MRLRFRDAFLSAGLGALILISGALARDRVQPVVGTPNNQCVVVNTHPEYWVDGKPFFEHAAAFFYHRIPRDRWAEELVRLKSMGINTIDLYPIWNWHQPEEGVLDFDGRTSPRRDLRYLLRLIDVMGFKLTFRPGPFFCSEWRNGGYPDWLLRRAEYHMSEQAILEGRYPRLSALQYDKSEEAAKEWMDNETHLRYTRDWYRHVLNLVNPLLADKGGPLINLQIDDDQAVGRENYNGPDFWKYMDLLRKYAKEATHDSRVPYYLNGPDMRVNAEANTALPEPFWNTGQDYQMSGEGGYSTVYEAAKNKFLTEILKTEPLFVPRMIEFRAGWLLDAKDPYARPTHPSNTLMASRVMFQNGLKALSYYPVHDTLDPAGYEAPWGNYFYSWEAAVNYAGKETGRAVYVRRNGRLIAGMGPLLGATHLAADAGLIYPIGTFPQEGLTPAEANAVAELAGRVLWSGVYDHYNFELVDSDHTPAENLQRYPVLLLPNLVGSKEEQKRYPHLERYSEKAQKMIADYVSRGGTLIVFPALPRGKVFDDLLSPLGEARLQGRDSRLQFADGATAYALGPRAILTLPKKPRVTVKVFARDVRGGVVGASFHQGRGRVLYFGADFSRWLAPPGTRLSFGEGGVAGARDYPEDVQKAARPALRELMKEADAARHVYPEMETTKARDPGLYVTELVADAREETKQNGFGFVGVTNFEVEEARSAEIVLADPRASSAGAREGTLRLPRLTLPPRESLMLPVRVPLRAACAEMAPGLEPDDEVYYATAELSRVSYDGAALRLEFTAPAEGEVALRLAGRPQRARIDGSDAAIQEDAQRRLYVVRIPKGDAPHFLRTIELIYPREGPRVVIDPRAPWIAGETRAVRMRVENPRLTALEGNLDFVAGGLYRQDNPPLVVHIPPQSSREFSFPVEIPRDAAEDQPVELVASFREKASATVWSWRSAVVIHHPFEYSLTPIEVFPLREDQAIPIVHPTFASLKLPGEARFQLHVRNWLEHEQIVTLSAEGENLDIAPGIVQLVIPTGGEVNVELRAAPTGGSGLYRFEIRLHAGAYEVREGVAIAAIREGEAVAYAFDYDRDGFDDIVLENANVRLFVSPHAGGRSFAYVLKETNANAFDSVGAMRDSFLTRFAPEDMKGLPEWTNANWLGLYNRPYSFTIVTGAGPRAEVHFVYEAPDIYPKGVEVERRLTLAGMENVVLSTTRATPRGIEKPQAYVLESSVPFRSFDQANHSQWFAFAHPREDFVPSKKIDLGLRVGFVGTLNKQANQTFALMLLTPAQNTQLVVEDHSALIRATYPAFTEKNRVYTYQVGYYLGTEPPENLDKLFARFKAAGQP